MSALLASTRFNTNTLNENRQFKQKNQINGCIYGTPLMVRTIYSPNSLLFICDMNNDTNEIAGIGMVLNRTKVGKYNIYSDANYNRYVYKGKYYIDRAVLEKKCSDVLEILEYVLFYGKQHLKRVQGISVLGENRFDDIYYKGKLMPYEAILNKITQVFKEEFASS